MSAHHPRNLAMAKLAFDNGIPADALEICLQEATERGMSLNDIAVSKGLITAQQSQFLFEQTANLASLSSGANPGPGPAAHDMTIRENLAASTDMTIRENLVDSTDMTVRESFLVRSTDPTIRGDISHEMSGELTVRGQFDPQMSGDLTVRGDFGAVGPADLTVRGDFSGEMTVPRASDPDLTVRNNFSGEMEPDGRFQPSGLPPNSMDAATIRGDFSAEIARLKQQSGFPMTPHRGVPPINVSGEFQGSSDELTVRGSQFRPQLQQHSGIVPVPQQGLSGPSSSYLAAPSSKDLKPPSSYNSHLAQSTPFHSTPSNNLGVVVDSCVEAQIFTGPRYEKVEILNDQMELVKDRRIGRTVTIFRCKPEWSEQKKQAFLRPAFVLGQFDHAEIPKIHDLDMNGSPYFAMERRAGQKLSEIDPTVDERFRTQNQVVRVFLQVVSALQHCHEREYVHTRVTPEAVTVGTFGQVTVSKWQNVTSFDQLDDDAANIMYLYQASNLKALAPEIEAGDPIDERTDVWGLGSVLFYLLTGKHANSQRNSSDLAGKVYRGQTLPAELKAILQRCLEEIAEDRYQTVSELESDLRGFLDGEKIQALQESLFQSLKRVSRKNPLQTVVLAAFLLLFICMTGYFVFDLQRTVSETGRLRIAAQTAKRTARDKVAAVDAEMAKSQLPREVAIGLADFDSVLLQTERLAATAEADNPPELKASLTLLKQSSETLDNKSKKQNSRDATGSAQRQYYLAKGDLYLRIAQAANPRFASDAFAKALSNSAREERFEAKLNYYIAERRYRSIDNFIDIGELGQTQDDHYAQLLEHAIRIDQLERICARFFHIDRNRPTVAVQQDLRQIADQLNKKLTKSLVDSMEAFASEKYPLPFGQELAGRFYRVIAVWNTYGKWFKLRKDEFFRPKAVFGNVFYKARKCLLNAFIAEPTAPEVLLQYASVYNTVWGAHQSWRPINAYLLQNFLDNGRTVFLPESLYSGLSTLETVQHEAGVYSLLKVFEDRCFQKVDEEKLSSYEAKVVFLTFLALQLKFEAKPREIDLSGFKPSENLAAEVELILAYQSMKAARKTLAKSHFGVFGSKLKYASSDSTLRCIKILTSLLEDESLNAGEVNELVSDYIMQAHTHPFMVAPVVSFLELRQRAGLDVQRQAQFAQRFIQQVFGGMGARPGQRVKLPRLLDRAEKKFNIFAVNQQIAFNRVQSSTFGFLFQQIMGFNTFEHNEEYVYAFHRTLKDYYQLRGADDQLAAGRDFDVVSSLWVRRFWVHERLHCWSNARSQFVAPDLNIIPGGQKKR